MYAHIAHSFPLVAFCCAFFADAFRDYVHVCVYKNGLYIRLKPQLFHTAKQLRRGYLRMYNAVPMLRPWIFIEYALKYVAKLFQGQIAYCVSGNVHAVGIGFANEMIKLIHAEICYAVV